MTTTAIGTGQVLTQELAQETTAPSTEFAQMLGEVQSGAPPGPEPPPQKVPEVGAVTLTPNAGAQTLDLLPEFSKTEEQASEGEIISADLLKLIASQAIPVPLPSPVVITTAASAMGQKPVDQAASVVEGLSATSIKDADTLQTLSVDADAASQIANATGIRPERARFQYESPVDPTGSKPIPESAMGSRVIDPAGEKPKPVPAPYTGAREQVNVPSAAQGAKSLDQDVLTDVTAVDISRSTVTQARTPDQAAIDAEQQAEVKLDETIVAVDEQVMVTDGSKERQSEGQQFSQPEPAVVEIAQPTASETPFQLADTAAEASAESNVQIDTKGEPRVEMLTSKAQVAESNRTETAAEAQMQLPKETVSRIVKETADRLELMAVARANDTVTVRLDPQDLGSITMIVKSAGNEVDAQITASNDQVRAALEQNRAQLNQAMESRGLNLSSLNVGSQSTSGQTAADGQKQECQQQAQQSRQQLGYSREFNGPSLEAQRAYIRSTYGVDVWI